MHVLSHRAALLIGIAAGFLPTAPLHAASTNYSAIGRFVSFAITQHW